MQETIEIVMKGHKCMRCSHSWIPRNKDYPRQCPKCHSCLWDREKEKRMRA